MADMQTFIDAADGLLKGQLPTPLIMKLLISKLLGYAILAGACITKIPQIIAITSARSAAGLSPLSVELETFGLLIAAAYGVVQNLAFSMYGEVFALAAQNLVILALIYHYGKQPAVRAAGVFTLLAGLCAAIFTNSIPIAWVHTAFDLNNLVMVAARVPQIVSNHRAGSTGQLSTITCVINLVGVCIRMFTTLSEGGGPAMMRGYVIGFLLHLTLVIQIIVFRGKAPIKKKVAKPTKKQA